MNTSIYKIALALIAISFVSSCTKTKTERVEVHVKPPMDTTTQSVMYTVSGPSINRMIFPKGLNLNFNPQKIHYFNNKIYVANSQGFRVDVIDAQSCLPVQAFSDSSATAIPYTLMLPSAIYADNQYIFVASANPLSSQIYIYQNNTYKYLNRIGDGAPAGMMKYPYAITANHSHVFVKDQTAAIKIFKRSDLEQPNIQPLKIVELLEPVTTEHFSMSMIGADTLATVNPAYKSVILFNVSDLSSAAPMQSRKIEIPDFVPMALTSDNRYVYVSGEYEAAVNISGTFVLVFDKKLFCTGVSTTPLFKFHQTGSYKYTPITSMAYFDNSLVFNQNNERLEIIRLKQSSVEIYNPKK